MQDESLVGTIHLVMQVPIPEKMANEVRLKLLRKYEDSGMSQDELAEESGVTQATISNYFRGKKSISIATLTRIARVLNLDVESGAYVRLI